MDMEGCGYGDFMRVMGQAGGASISWGIGGGAKWNQMWETRVTRPKADNEIGWVLTMNFRESCFLSPRQDGGIAPL